MQTPLVTSRSLSLVPYALGGSAFAMFVLLLVGELPLLALTATLLAAASSLFAWHSVPHAADGMGWLRLPLLLIPVLLLLHVCLNLGAAWAGVPLLAHLAQTGVLALVLACLLVSATALLVPDERSSLGARAMRQARSYRLLTFGAALAGWLLLLASRLVTRDSVALNAAYPVLLGGLGLLLALIGAQTWRTRRTDALLSGAVLLAALTLATLAALLLAGRLMGDALVQSLALAQFLTVLLWVELTVLAVLAVRRPMPALAAAAAPTGQPSLLKDYVGLTKPKVISLLLVTTLGAMFITGEGPPSLGLVFWTLLGGYLAAGGAGAINCAFDKDIDNLMGRTSRRPVPSGRINQRAAFWFGVALAALSFVVLAWFTTLMAAVLAIVGVVYYTLIYTRWLKRRTWQNIVIGGGAGAIPPLVGWAAVTGSLSLPALILFAIVFYWTPPHFWALALVKEKDYARAGVPMLPVVAGEHETRWQIWLYSLLMFALSLILTPLGAMGWLYLLAALLLGGLFLRSAWLVWRVGGQGPIWGLYKYSLLYLALLFVAMIADRLLLA